MTCIEDARLIFMLKVDRSSRPNWRIALSDKNRYDKVAKRYCFHHPVIAQLVERQTVVVPKAICWSPVRLRVAGLPIFLRFLCSCFVFVPYYLEALPGSLPGNLFYIRHQLFLLLLSPYHPPQAHCGCNGSLCICLRVAFMSGTSVANDNATIDTKV